MIKESHKRELKRNGYSVVVKNWVLNDANGAIYHWHDESIIKKIKNSEIKLWGFSKKNDTRCPDCKMNIPKIVLLFSRMINQGG